MECKPDRTLIEVLTNASRKSIIHAANKSEAIKILIKTKKPSIAVVDEDPGSPYKKPRLEEWLIKAGRECNISFGKYNLPEKGKKLHDVINLNIKRLEGVLKEMLNIKCLRLSKLKQELEA